MMKLEHVAMYVNDLESARDFFVKYLGGRSNDGYHNSNRFAQPRHQVFVAGDT